MNSIGLLGVSVLPGSRIHVGPAVLPPSTLPAVGPWDWSFETAAVVDAGPEDVMAWWFHPDRRKECQERIEKTGARDVSVTQTTTDGVRVRVACWTDRRGWDTHHQVETRLGPDGMPAGQGDRYIAPASDVVSFNRRSGQKMTVTCMGRLEFIPHESGDTEIRTVHHHTLTGGRWIQRWSVRRSDHVKSDRVFRESITRCRAAVGRPPP